MNLEDFYRGRGEDYPVIIGRFMGNENLLKKFVKNFPDDPTYGRLCEARYAFIFRKYFEVFGRHTVIEEVSQKIGRTDIIYDYDKQVLVNNLEGLSMNNNDMRSSEINGQRSFDFLWSHLFSSSPSTIS